MHINVFGHYYNFLLETINTIIKRNDIKKLKKEEYLIRFSSQLSYFELIYLGYYTLYFIEDELIKKIIIKNFLFRIMINKNSRIPHFDRAEFLIKRFNL